MAPLSALLLAGCLASKGDVALLRSQLSTMSQAAASANEASGRTIEWPIDRAKLGMVGLL